MNLLVQYLRPHVRKLVVLGVLLAVGLGGSLAGPQVLRRFIDLALAGSDTDRLVRLGLLYVGVGLVIHIVTVLTGGIATDLALRTTNALRRDLTLHTLRLDAGFHHEHSPGELIERVDGDVSVLATLLSTFVVQLLRDAILLVVVLVLLFGIDVRVGGVVLLSVVVISATIFLLREIAVPRWQRHRELVAEQTGFTEEHLSGTEDVRANGAVDYVLLGFLQRGRNALWAEVKASLAGSASWVSARILFGIGQAAALGVAIWLVGRRTLTVGDAYVVLAYVSMIGQPLEALGRHVQYLQQAAASVRRIAELSGTTSRIADKGAESAPRRPSVHLDGVTFGYGDEAVLRDVSLSVPAGTSLGLLGRTGSGKSSVTRLLVRLYDTQSGVVRLDDVAVGAVGLHDLRTHVAVVTQEVHLFSASVRDNVTVFDPSADDDSVRRALTDIGLHEWTSRLDETLDPHGVSAGEAQLLAFARVLVRDPDVIVLDEASSRLDPATERRLQSATDRLLAGRTSIVIAHRLETLSRVDAIAIMEGGRILENGARADLAADPRSRFARLLAGGEAAEEVLA